jgi:hypothetical protein
MRWNNIGERIDIGQVLKIKKPWNLTGSFYLVR